MGMKSTISAEMRPRRLWFRLLTACFAMIFPISGAQTSRSGVAASRQSKSSTQNLHAADVAFRAGSAAYMRNDLRTAHAEFAKLVRLAPNVAAGHAAFGAVLLAEGNADAAITQLKRARKLDPTDTSAILNLALAYSQLHKYADSVAMFQLLGRAARGSAPALSPDAAIAYATALDATGQPAAAQQQLSQALVSSPENAVLHDALGSLLAQQQRYDEAKSEFQQALVLNPALASAHFHLGSVFLDENDSRAAVRELTQANDLAKTNAGYAIQLGRALRTDGQDDAAIHVLRHAIELDATSISARYELALTLQASGDAVEALPFFREVEEKRPEDAYALTNLALALVQTGDAKDAISFYLRALTLTPHDATLREDLGVAYLQQSDLDHAIEQFRAGLNSDPGDAYLHYDLGLALKLKDNPSAAITELVSAEKLAPQLPDPPYTLGVLYMQLAQFPQSQAELEKAIALRPDNGDAWALLGNIYKQLDQLPKAIAALQHAIQLLPNQPSPHITLAAILSEEGDHAGAVAERKKAAELSRAAVSRQRANFALDSGKALLSRGQLAQAIVQLQTAVDADPTFVEAHMALANALAQQGRSADAAIERQKAQQLRASSSLAGPSTQ